MSNLWAGMRKVPAANDTKGQKFEPNFVGDLKVVRCFEKKPRKGGSAFIAELQVIATNLPDIHPIGSKPSWYQQLGGVYPDLFLTAVKEMVAATMGVNPRDPGAIATTIDPIIEETMDLVVGPDNALEGRRVHLETSTYQNLQKQDRTGMRWSVYEEGEEAGDVG